MDHLKVARLHTGKTEISKLGIMPLNLQMKQGSQKFISLIV